MKFLLQILSLILFFPIVSHSVVFEVNATKIHIIQGDIVKGTYTDGKNTFTIDAIVNAANCQLARGGGVCGAIFQAAEGNGTDLQDYIHTFYPHGIKTGEAILTPSFGLQKQEVKYIIHAVGPIYKEYSNKKEAARLLKDAYRHSLECAHENNIISLAFPFISSAIYGYPKPEAACIALEALKDFFVIHKKSTISNVYMVLFSKEDYEIFLKTSALIGLL